MPLPNVEVLQTGEQGRARSESCIMLKPDIEPVADARDSLDKVSLLLLIIAMCLAD